MAGREQSYVANRASSILLVRIKPFFGSRGLLAISSDCGITRCEYPRWRIEISDESDRRAPVSATAAHLVCASTYGTPRHSE